MTTAFEVVQPENFKRGFYSTVNADSKKRIVLLRVPKGVKAADLDGVTVEMGSKGVGNLVHLEDTKTGLKQTYQMSKVMNGSVAPVALALPSPSTGSFSVEKSFDQVWNLGLVVDAPKTSLMVADLEEDVSALHWRSIPQVTELKSPLSAFDIQVNSNSSRDESKDKKSKKRKHQD